MEEVGILISEKFSFKDCECKPAEIKVKVEALKAKQKDLHTARKALHENLKDKSKEDREALIADFKKDNKAKHEEIKAKAKEVKEEIRALVETEATRTSDL